MKKCKENVSPCRTISKCVKKIERDENVFSNDGALLKLHRTLQDLYILRYLRFNSMPEGLSTAVIR